MAGIFGFFDFTKPGKGVDPNEPEKRAFFRYFELLWRKLSKLAVVNMMYFVCVLPLILAFHTLAFEPLMNFAITISGAEGEFVASPILSVFSFVFNLPMWLLAALLALGVLLFGPVTCGLTYILRNYVRGEHAWYSDFWQRAKSNFKQGVFLGVLDFIMFSAAIYNFSLLASGGGGPTFLTWTALFVFLIYLSMRNTTYLMAVTVELSNAQLLRNAVILTLAGVPRHFLTGIIYALAIYLILLLNGFIELFALPFIAFSLLGFTSVFINYPLIDKFLIQPLRQEETEENA